MINCLQALEKLYDFVDGELPPADRAAVQEHLEACRPCLTHFEFETLFADFVRRRATVPAAREAFKDRLFSRLREEERSRAPMTVKDTGGRWRFAIAASFLLLLAVAATRLAGPTSSGVDWPRLAAYASQPAPAGAEDGIDTGDLGAARAFVTARMGEPIGQLVPGRAPSGLSAQEACILPWNTGRIAQVEFDGGFGEASLFLGTVRCFPMTTEPKVAINGQSYRLATIDGMRAVCWEDEDGLACVLVSGAEFPMVLAWAESVRGSGR